MAGTWGELGTSGQNRFRDWLVTAVYPVAHDRSMTDEGKFDVLRLIYQREISPRPLNSGGVKSGNDYVVSDEDNLNRSWSMVNRFDANIRAIRLLKRLETQNRMATPSEQSVLAQYVGWGGMKSVFDSRNKGVSVQYKTLRDTLMPAEYAEAQSSTMNAHYTADWIARSMWDAVRRLGFASGDVLEPAFGTGIFKMTQPEDIGANTRWTTVEKDSLTARIAKQLNQSARAYLTPFEKFPGILGTVDLAISNVPFRDGARINDPAFADKPWIRRSLHDYYFAKSLDHLRPGGLMAFITSTGTLDKQESFVRDYLAQRADFLGAIRLPAGAFKDNANTEVSTDIVFLRKRVAGETPVDTKWKNLVDYKANGDTYRINEYFAEHPEMMLGEWSRGGLYGPEQQTLRERKNQDTAALLAEAVNRLKPGAYNERPADVAASTDTTVYRPYSNYVADGQHHLNDQGILVRRIGTKTFPVEHDQPLITDAIKLHDAMLETLRAQRDLTDDNDPRIIETREQLGKMYDAYREKWGAIGDLATKKALVGDPMHDRLSGLERVNDEMTKSAIFTKRVLNSERDVTSVDSPEDALSLSVSRKGRVDVPYIAKLLGTTEEEAVKSLGSSVFHDPQAGIVTAEDYLSGNVRQKLREARFAAAEDGSFARNIAALEAAQPKDLEPGEMTVVMSSPIIPSQMATQFAEQVIGRRMFVSRDPDTNKWRGTGHAVHGAESEASDWDVMGEYGYRTGDKILVDTLNNKPSVVNYTVVDKDGVKHTYVDEEATKMARIKQNLMRQRFEAWVWEDGNRAADFTRAYNDAYNIYVYPEYDGSRVKYSGADPTWVGMLRKHQRDAGMRIMRGGNVYLAHDVGTGKSLTMISASMQMRQGGLRQKLMHSVPKSVLNGYLKQWRAMYPGAQILVFDAAEGQALQRNLSRIQAGDYDGILVTHEFMNAIPLSEARVDMIVAEQIEALERSYMERPLRKGERMGDRIKRLESEKERVKDRYRDMIATEGLTWDDLGIDQVFVDEAHRYKNLFFSSTLTGSVRGLGKKNGTPSANNLYAKVRSVQERNNGGGVVFASGTPLSNSLMEIYSTMRMLQPKNLAEMNVRHGDQWLGAFGTIEARVENTGLGYEEVARLREIKNSPELKYAQRQVMDMVPVEMVENLSLPKMVSGAMISEVSPLTDEFNAFLQALMVRAANLPQGWIHQKGDDNILAVNTTARIGAIDLRLVAPSATAHPGGKIYKAAQNILDYYNRRVPAHLIKESTGVTEPDQWQKNNVQLVFSDFGVDEGKSDAKKFSAFAELRKQLIAGGIPAEEIVIVREESQDARDQLFEQANAGKIRVLMGGTKNLGQGVNVQERVLALHMLDVPYTAESLEQRIGRMVRQGNTHEHVFAHQYLQEGSFDEYMYGLVSRKSSPMKRYLDPNNRDRVLIMDDPQSMSYRTMSAVASRSPAALEYMGIENKVMALEAEKFMHENSVRKARINQAKYLDELMLARERAQKAEALKPPTVRGVFEKGATNDLPIEEGATYRFYKARAEQRQKLKDVTDKAKTMDELFQDQLAKKPAAPKVDLKPTAEALGMQPDTPEAPIEPPTGDFAPGTGPEAPTKPVGMTGQLKAIDQIRELLAQPNRDISADELRKILTEPADTQAIAKAKKQVVVKAADYVYREWSSDTDSQVGRGQLALKIHGYDVTISGGGASVSLNGVPIERRPLAYHGGLGSLIESLDSPNYLTKVVEQIRGEITHMQERVQQADRDSFRTWRNEELLATTKARKIELEKLLDVESRPTDNTVTTSDGPAPDDYGQFAEDQRDTTPDFQLPDDDGDSGPGPLMERQMEDPNSVTSADTLGRYQDREMSAHGDWEPPRYEDMISHATRQSTDALEVIRKAAQEHMAKVVKETPVTKEMRDVLWREMRTAIKHQNEVVAGAKTYAKEATNFGLLDYGSRRGFDLWLSLLAPFSFWTTRQGRNYAIRLMHQPQYLAAYLRFKEALEKENRNRGGRKRFNSSVRIPLTQMSGGAMSDLYIDPIETFFPFSGLMGRDVMDGDEQKTALQQLYTLGDKVGMRPSPIIDMAARVTGALQADGSAEQKAAWGPGSIGTGIPQSGIIQGASAVLGLGGPLGINVEEPVRRAFGLPDTARWDPYRMTRTVADMAAEVGVKYGPGADIRPYLAAQEWISRHKETDLAQQMRSATAETIAAELKIDPKIAQGALEVAKQAGNRSAKQRAVGQLGSSMLGLRLQEEPVGEQIRGEMSRLEKSAAYNPATGTGSREEVKAVQAQYPALQVQRGQYGALPGDQRDPGYLLDSANRSQVNQAFDQMKDSILSMRPWDRKATRIVEDARWAALNRVDRGRPDAEKDWHVDYQKAMAKLSGVPEAEMQISNLAYKPLSVSGSTPAEAMQTRQSEVMRVVVKTQPRVEAFTGPDGKIAWDAYNSTVDAWEKQLPMIAKGIPEVYAVLAQSDKEGRGDAVRNWLDNLGATDIETYRRRNDTALEAAQRMYFDGVYSPAMKAYDEASAQGVPDAWNQTVGSVGAMSGKQIAPLVRQVYGNRFTPEDAATLEKLVFPPAVDIMRSNMSEAAKFKDDARSLFWDYMNQNTPPGSDAYTLRQIPLVSAALDQSSRSTVTAEQYQSAYGMARGWVAENVGEVTPEIQAEWAKAREQKKALDSLLMQTVGPDGVNALNAYLQAPSAAEKERIRLGNIKVMQALNLRLAFSKKNPIYAKYYRSSAKPIPRVTRRPARTRGG